MDDVDPTEREGLTQHPTPNSAGNYLQQRQPSFSTRNPRIENLVTNTG